jgi:hypothetical protein
MLILCLKILYIALLFFVNFINFFRPETVCFMKIDTLKKFSARCL